MLSQNKEYQGIEVSEAILSVSSHFTEEDIALEPELLAPSKFSGCYQDKMTMYAPVEQVAEYLNSHSSWFSRCAEPMKVKPLGNNGYALSIGKFGAFGYEVEPKIGLELLPPEEGAYRIYTIPIPNYKAPGYEVDYRASLQLVEDMASGDNNNFSGHITQVEWELDLTVYMNFPKFIHRLPKSLVQSTGDRLLNQIVRQVSRRLTLKVQNNFHETLDIPFPHNCKHTR